MSFFNADSLRFLKALAKNNRRDWFEKNKENYLRDVRDPMGELVEDLDLRMARFAPEITGDAKRSLFRIHRDVRFSKDKSPYKTNAGCWFFHADASSKVGREAHGGGAGFYFHLQPGASFVAGGLWMPPRPGLLKIRAAIAKDTRAFEKIALAPGLRRRMGALSEESALKRVPRGYDADHPAARWLRLQSFTVGRSLSDAEVTGAKLASTLSTDYKTITPLVRWLNGVLGLPPYDAR